MSKISQKEILKNMTRNELDSIRKRLNIKGVSKLSKDALVDKITSYLEENLEDILRTQVFGEDRVLIEAALKSGGELNIEDFLTEDKIVCPYALKSLLELGIFMEDRETGKCFISSDLMFKLNSFFKNKGNIAIVERRDEILKVLKGLLFYYGLAEEDIIVKISRKYLPKNNSEEIIETIRDYVIGHKDIIQKENIYMLETVDESLIEARKNMENVPFYRPKVDLVKDMAEKFAIEDTEFERSMVDFMTSQLGIEEAYAYRALYELLLEMRNGYDPSQIFNKYVEALRVNNDNGHNFLESFKALYLNTRSWKLKGNTPKELGFSIQ